MTVYAQHVSTKRTPQSEPIPGTNQQQNNAGGFSFVLDDWSRLDRFLVLGCEGNTLYAGERKMTADNAGCVRRCLDADPARTVARIVEISEAGRAPKNDPAVFALALALAHKSTDADKQEAAHDAAEIAVSRVCRTASYLFQLIETVDGLRGWGRGLRGAIAGWYASKAARDPRDLAYQVVKYQQRNGWSHRDLLRLAHPKASGVVNDIFHYAVKGWPGVGDEPHPEKAMLPIWAAERAKRAESVAEIVRLIEEYDLVRECIPTKWLTEAAVWEALLVRMPLTAMVRNLATMTRVGLLAPLSVATKTVCERLADGDYIRKGRLHPVAMLSALKTYAQGHGERGKSTWTPVQTICDALDGAFYLSFGNVTATGKRWLIGVDVSGSMECGTVAGVPGLTPRVAAGALALVTAATEPQHHIVGFSHQLVPLAIGPKMRLDAVCRTMATTPMGRTDCAQPFIYAMAAKLPVDVFVTLTDNETYYGRIHPSQALNEYRQRTGIAAKSVVVGMTATAFTVADPNDAESLDVVGMDTATPQLMSEFAVA